VHKAVVALAGLIVFASLLLFRPVRFFALAYLSPPPYCRSLVHGGAVWLCVSRWLVLSDVISPGSVVFLKDFPGREQHPSPFGGYVASCSKAWQPVGEAGLAALR